MTINPLLLKQYGPLPHDEAAETAVLASILIDPKQAMPAVRRLTSASFYKVSHQLIFQAMLELAEKTADQFDEIMLADALQNSGKLESIGGLDYLVRLACHLTTASDIDQYVNIVYNKMALRRLKEIAVLIFGRCQAVDVDAMIMMDNLEKDIMEIFRNRMAARDGDIDMKKLWHETFIRLKEYSSQNNFQALGSSRGLITGFVELDRLIRLRPGEMIVLASRPSIGKTALALSIASNIATSLDNPAKVGIFSLEMSREILAMRLLCSEAGIHLGQVRDNTLSSQEWEDISLAADRWKRAPIFIEDTPGLDILELRAKARRMHAEHQIECLFIDHIQLLRTGFNNYKNNKKQMAWISEGIKALAQELRIPIVVLAQLNRQAEEMGPKLSHLRESGSIEQDADIVMLLHRQRCHEADPGIRPPSIPAELIVVKHRNGPTGKVDLQFFPTLTRFRSASRVDDQDFSKF